MHWIYWLDQCTMSIEHDIKFQEHDTHITLPMSLVPTPTAPPVVSTTPTPTSEGSQLEGEREGPKLETEAQLKANLHKGIRSLTVLPVKEVDYAGSRATHSGATLGTAAALVKDFNNLHVGGLNFAMAAVICDAARLELMSLEAAWKRDDWPMWQDAMQKELDSLEKAGTWELVEKLEGKNIIGCKWVYHLKFTVDHTIDKYKAHLVACSYTQIYDIDYTDTFTPVV
ncbi:hypothetical protein NM688_g59 [Phlebia brevispora]|uniref:Uncharacterized protein n=1 Tax=Phlebia brevispora TaxID=194682 RepID=A0ACC1TFF9_9APHY|nr:hypothetical protein NM688_g59 [Phlebia brevispora]